MDYVLCLPCQEVNADEDDPDFDEEDYIIVEMIVRFKDEDHHDMLCDVGTYSDIIDELNEALANKKGTVEDEKKEQFYYSKYTDWYICDAGIDVYESYKVGTEGKPKLPDVDLTKPENKK